MVNFEFVDLFLLHFFFPFFSLKPTKFYFYSSFTSGSFQGDSSIDASYKSIEDREEFEHIPLVSGRDRPPSVSLLHKCFFRIYKCMYLDMQCICVWNYLFVLASCIFIFILFLHSIRRYTGPVSSCL